MISLAGRDILHAWGKFVFTGIGLGLLIGVTLVMAGVYRGMVDDGKALLDNSGADLWVVQRDTLGPYAESSSLNDDTYRAILAMPGVAQAANVTYLTTQVRKGESDVRTMVVGIAPGKLGATPGWPPYLVAGRQLTRGHYETVADIATGFKLGDRISIRRNHYTVVGLTRRMVSSSGDPMVFIPLKDAQEAQFLKDNDAIWQSRRRTEANPVFNRPGVPGLLDADRHVSGDSGHRQRGHRGLHHLFANDGQDPRDRGAQAHRHAQPNHCRHDHAASARPGRDWFRGRQDICHLLGAHFSEIRAAHAHGFRGGFFRRAVDLHPGQSGRHSHGTQGRSGRSHRVMT